MRFQGKVAVVTGAASGFGEAIARRLALEGAAVLLADVNEAGGRRVTEEIAKEHDGRARFVRADVSRGEDVARMIQTAVGELGGLHVVVNNAGIAHRSMPLAELPEGDFERVFAVNVRSVYLAAVHAVPVLRAAGGGVIVNVASIGAVRPRPNMTAYNATKGAVVVLTRGLAVELAPHRIRVCAVNPLAAETGFIRGALGVDRLPDPVREAMIREVPLRRLTQTSDVATAVAFLASDEAEFLTGVCLDVDGGKSIS